MIVVWLAFVGITAALLLFATGDRWVLPRGWGRSPFGADIRPKAVTASTVVMVRVPSGLALASRVLSTAAEPRALAVIVHGLCLNSTWYMSLARACVAGGIGAALLDLHGHGRSQGRRGYLPPRGDIIADLAHAILQISADHPNVRLILVGHSAGAEFALSVELAAALERGGASIMGACGIAPYLAGGNMQRRFNIRCPLISINPRGLLSSRWPALHYNLPGSWSDQDLQASFDRSLLKLLESGEPAARRLAALAFPVLLLVGEHDEIIAPASVIALGTDRVHARVIPATDHMTVVPAASGPIMETFLRAGSHAESL
jgi:alpha-beta hydrolase superfamily lysophospholipase